MAFVETAQAEPVAHLHPLPVIGRRNLRAYQGFATDGPDTRRTARPQGNGLVDLSAGPQSTHIAAARIAVGTEKTWRY